MPDRTDRTAEVASLVEQRVEVSTDARPPQDLSRMLVVSRRDDEKPGHKALFEDADDQIEAVDVRKAQSEKAQVRMGRYKVRPAISTGVTWGHLSARKDLPGKQTKCVGAKAVPLHDDNPRDPKNRTGRTRCIEHASINARS